MIDKRDTQDLNGNYIVKNYECHTDRTGDEFYRYIRLRQTGKTSGNYNNLRLSEIELRLRTATSIRFETVTLHK